MLTMDYLIGLADISFRYLDTIIEEARRERSKVVAEATGTLAKWIAARGKSFVTLVRARIEERSNLAELQRLDDRTLADIGLDRSMIYAAARGTIGGGAANWNNPMPVAANSNEPRAA